MHPSPHCTYLLVDNIPQLVMQLDSSTHLFESWSQNRTYTIYDLRKSRSTRSSSFNRFWSSSISSSFSFRVRVALSERSCICCVVLAVYPKRFRGEGGQLCRNEHGRKKKSKENGDYTHLGSQLAVFLLIFDDVEEDVKGSSENQ